jgi:hypothetical protein
MALGRAARREVLKLFALAPVRRGEGKGEGHGPATITRAPQ